MNPPKDEKEHVYRLEPPTANGPYRTEDDLLTALQQLQKREPLHRYQVHVYEGTIDAAHHLGTGEAIVIWIMQEVDLERFDWRSMKEPEQ